MPFTLQRDVDLTPLNTFRVPARASHFVRVGSKGDLAAVLDDPALRELPRLVLGGGSNVLFTKDFDGLVLHVAIAGRERLQDDADTLRVRVGAGEPWHGTVAALLDAGLPGLENLALIPGSVGGAPVQNIGAYGVELAERCAAVEVFDTHAGVAQTLDAAACRFAYRDSVFKHAPGRYIVLAVVFALPRVWRAVTGYADVAHELKARGVAQPGPRDVFDAVVSIRRRKLPDPDLIGNAGSFFKNPVVSRDVRNALLERHASMVSYDIGGGRCKLAAGWLIEACGLKGAVRGQAAVYDRQALVLVNRGAARGAEILALAREVQQRVADTFGVTLEPEPLIV
jgi:UDP-N-acetylmuramate dehydrogenase